MPRLMLATSADYPDLAPADKLYRSALERRGAEVETGVWADERAGFQGVDGGPRAMKMSTASTQ